MALLSMALLTWNRPFSKVAQHLITNIVKQACMCFRVASEVAHDEASPVVGQKAARFR
jgi:hypothetical protein